MKNLIVTALLTIIFTANFAKANLIEFDFENDSLSNVQVDLSKDSHGVLTTTDNRLEFVSYAQSEEDAWSEAIECFEKNLDGEYHVYFDPKSTSGQYIFYVNWTEIENWQVIAAL